MDPHRTGTRERDAGQQALERAIVEGAEPGRQVPSPIGLEQPERAIELTGRDTRRARQRERTLQAETVRRTIEPKISVQQAVHRQPSIDERLHLGQIEPLEAERDVFGRKGPSICGKPHLAVARNDTPPQVETGSRPSKPPTCRPGLETDRRPTHAVGEPRIEPAKITQ